jgi:hypothetical protein
VAPAGFRSLTFSALFTAQYASLILKVEIGLNAVVKEELMLGLNKGSSKIAVANNAIT